MVKWYWCNTIDLLLTCHQKNNTHLRNLYKGTHWWFSTIWIRSVIRETTKIPVIMYVSYQCCQKPLDDYYDLNQSGGGQNYYQGSPNFQRSYGLGGLFRSFFSAAILFFKLRAKAVGKQMLLSALNLVHFLDDSQNLVFVKCIIFIDTVSIFVNIFIY